MKKILEGHVIVPLKVADEFQLVIGATADGQKILLAVDSGAHSIFFHEALAKTLGLKLLQGSGTAIGSDGKPIALATGELKSLDLSCGIVLENQRFPFIDMGQFVDIEMDGKPAKLDGLLGQGFIQSTGMILDYDKKQMLFPVKGAKPGELIQALRDAGHGVLKLMRGSDDRHYIPVILDGEKVALMLDTGAHAATLYPEYAAQKKWEKREKSLTIRALGEDLESDMVIVPSIDFGGYFDVANYPFFLVGKSSDKHPEEVGGLKVVGLLGSNLLMPLRSVVDFGNNEIAFPVSQLKKEF